ISLAVTTLFWGAGATLQFIVIEWARSALNFDLSKAAILQGVTAVGIAIGAVLASAWISLERSVRVIPLGIAMGLFVIVMNFVHIWFMRNRRVHREEIDRLLAFARAEDPGPRSRKTKQE